jgi:hypothetical protein
MYYSPYIKSFVKCRLEKRNRVHRKKLLILQKVHDSIFERLAVLKTYSAHSTALVFCFVLFCWQHLSQKTQDKDNSETVATFVTKDTGQRQFRDSGNICHKRHRTKTKKTNKITQNRKLKQLSVLNMF